VETHCVFCEVEPIFRIQALQCLIFARATITTTKCNKSAAVSNKPIAVGYCRHLLLHDWAITIDHNRILSILITSYDCRTVLFQCIFLGDSSVSRTNQALNSIWILKSDCAKLLSMSKIFFFNPISSLCTETMKLQIP
jgi:hypothetical protein